MKQPYHSALIKHKVVDAKPMQFCRVNSGIAFVHDMAKGWPSAMNKADIIYSELPWMHGYIPFYERAMRKAEMNYVDFIVSVRIMLSKISAPSVIIAGKHAINHIRPPEYIPVTVNGDPAYACLWRTNPERIGNPRTEMDILNHIVKFYRCVGDPFCGYGRSGRAFAQAGKRFIMSDLNPTCIGFINEHGNGWYDENSG